nr:hypothetical protein [Shinella sp. PSBB067]
MDFRPVCRGRPQDLPKAVRNPVACLPPADGDDAAPGLGRHRRQQTRALDEVLDRMDARGRLRSGDIDDAFQPQQGFPVL